MLVIRFARRGRRNRAMFDLVLAEKTKNPKKKFIQKLGQYDPHATAGEGKFVFDQKAIEARVAQGAQVSDSAAKKLKNAGVPNMEKFIEKRVQKPKKEAPKPEVEEVAEAVEEAPAETKETAAEAAE